MTAETVRAVLVRNDRWLSSMPATGDPDRRPVTIRLSRGPRFTPPDSAMHDPEAQ